MSSTENIELWETLLKKSSKNSQQQQGGGTLLLVGDTGCGKRRLAASLSSLCPPSSSSRRGVTSGATSPAKVNYPEYISYSYFNAYGDGEDDRKIDVWRMCRQTFTDSADLILNPSRVNDNLAIAVAIDVSQPECATTLYTWLTLVNSAIDNFVGRRDEHRACSVPIPSGSGEEETKTPPSGSREDGAGTRRPPVLVIGCKADTLEAKEVESLARSKAIQGALRAVCLDGGASGLIFTSAAPSAATNKDSDTVVPSNCLALRSHLTVLLAAASSAPSSSLLGGGIIQDGTTDVIIPDMRADSAALILSATDVQADVVMNTIRENAHNITNSTGDSNPASSKSDEDSKEGKDISSPTMSSALLEEEGQWLRQFQSAVSSLDKESLLESTEAGNTSTGTTRRKSTLSNPLAAVGTGSKPSAAGGLTNVLEQSASGAGKEGGTKVVKKKKVGGEKKEKKEKKESPRGFFEDLLTK